jgi:hypothetical protein
VSETVDEEAEKIVAALRGSYREHAVLAVTDRIAEVMNDLDDADNGTKMCAVAFLLFESARLMEDSLGVSYEAAFVALVTLADEGP